MPLFTGMLHSVCLIDRSQSFATAIYAWSLHFQGLKNGNSKRDNMKSALFIYFVVLSFCCLNLCSFCIQQKHNNWTKITDIQNIYQINKLLTWKNMFSSVNLNRRYSPSGARQKGLSSCVHQKHAFRDNRICSVWMPIKNRIVNVTGWKFTVL